MLRIASTKIMQGFILEKGWIMFDRQKTAFHPITLKPLAKIHMTRCYDPIIRSKQSFNREWEASRYQLLCAKYVDNIIQVEKDIHKTFESDHYIDPDGGGKEFFTVSLERFVAAVKNIPGEWYDPLKNYNIKFDEQSTDFVTLLNKDKITGKRKHNSDDENIYIETEFIETEFIEETNKRIKLNNDYNIKNVFKPCKNEDKIDITQEELMELSNRMFLTNSVGKKKPSKKKSTYIPVSELTVEQHEKRKAKGKSDYQKNKDKIKEKRMKNNM